MPHYTPLALGVALLTLAAPTWAAAPSALTCKDPVFACTLEKSGKQVQVCEQDARIVYRFGAPQQAPELQFERPRKAVRITPWNGMGHTYWSSLEMDNGAWTYRLASSYERGEPTAPGQGSITVLRAGKEQRRLICEPYSVRERIESLAP
jgi:hypothetical protein